MESMCGGGAEKVLTNLLHNFDSSKYHLTLLLLNASGPHLSNIPDYVEIISLNRENSFIVRYGLLYKRHFRKRLWIYQLTRALGDQRFDTIVSFMEGPAALLHSILFNRADKHISWVHTNLMTNHWTKTFYASLEDEKNIYSHMDDIVFVSSGAKNAFQQMFGIMGRLHVIPNIIDRDHILKKANGETSITHECFTICNIGRLTEQKRQDRLIEVAAELKQRGLNFTLWILGAGKLEQKLKQLSRTLEVDDKVVFFGFKSNPYPYLKAADVFLLTSDTEGYPTVICEALCLAKPIVSTNITGADELLADEVGILTSKDVTDIADNVENLIRNPERLTQYANRSHKKSLQFDSKAVISKIEELI